MWLLHTSVLNRPRWGHTQRSLCEIKILTPLKKKRAWTDEVHWTCRHWEVRMSTKLSCFQSNTSCHHKTFSHDEWPNLMILIFIWIMKHGSRLGIIMIHTTDATSVALLNNTCFDVVCRGLMPESGSPKRHENGTCHFSAQHSAFWERTWELNTQNY